MKYIFEIILATIIIFFLWNMMKRIFFSSFYKFPEQQEGNGTTTQKTKKNLDSKLNWDAETVEYEEVKEEKTAGK